MLVALPAVGAAVPVRAGDVRAAVAANFREAASEVGAAFEAATPHSVRYSFGSTGQLYAQIAFGAPFDVFLAADASRPENAIEEGFGVEGTQFTYATGRVVLYSAARGLVSGPEALHEGRFSALAIAEPTVAPYGAAAVETMRRIGAYTSAEGRLVFGLSVAQAFQFVQTGSADLGFVALAQIARRTGGSRWIVPSDFHEPIRQDAVLLERGARNPAARAFLAFLKGSEAEAILDSFGYGRED